MLVITIGIVATSTFLRRLSTDWLTRCTGGQLRVQFGGSASWGKHQLGEVPVGGQGPVEGQKFNPDEASPEVRDFFIFILLIL